MANTEQVDVALVGGGDHERNPRDPPGPPGSGLEFAVLERLDGIALESTMAANNAGTGHAANCELNYTPEKHDGTVDINKALVINRAFEISL